MELPSSKEKYAKLFKILSMTQDDTGKVLLVKIPTLISFLDQLPSEVLAEVLNDVPDNPPPLESLEWVSWFKNTCEIFQIPREKFIEGARIDKGDLSKFEAHKINFSPTKRKRLLKVISDETGYFK